MVDNFITTLLVALTLFVSGCTDRMPAEGSLIYAEVGYIVQPGLYRAVKAGSQSERINNPHRTQQILDAINKGVTENDVRSGRLVMCRCALGNEFGVWWTALTPSNMSLKPGDYVELEVGVPSQTGQLGTLSQVVQQISRPENPDRYYLAYGPLIKCKPNG